MSLYPIKFLAKWPKRDSKFFPNFYFWIFAGGTRTGQIGDGLGRFVRVLVRERERERERLRFAKHEAKRPMLRKHL